VHDQSGEARAIWALLCAGCLSFAVSAASLAVGIAYLPLGAWPRAFLAIGLLFVVTSAFTLAKCVRDQQEAGEVISRVDQARLEKLLAEHDLFKVPAT
jgi:hypothetical protein